MAEEIKQEYGIEQTKELFLAVSMLAEIMIKALKDGAQAADMAILFQELAKPEHQEMIKKAMDQVSMVPAELKDMKMDEAFVLAPLMIGELKKWIEAAKK